jgi:hypothetical protein
MRNNNARWINAKQEKPNYDNHYCCIYKGEYKICFFNPYSNKWYEFNHETDVDFWLDDSDWFDTENPLDI